MSNHQRNQITSSTADLTSLLSVCIALGRFCWLCHWAQVPDHSLCRKHSPSYATSNGQHGLADGLVVAQQCSLPLSPIRSLSFPVSSFHCSFFVLCLSYSLPLFFILFMFISYTAHSACECRRALRLCLRTVPSWSHSQEDFQLGSSETWLKLSQDALYNPQTQKVHSQPCWHTMSGT